jgi:hypothetical protein
MQGCRKDKRNEDADVAVSGVLCCVISAVAVGVVVVVDVVDRARGMGGGRWWW